MLEMFKQKSEPSYKEIIADLQAKKEASLNVFYKAKSDLEDTNEEIDSVVSKIEIELIELNAVKNQFALDREANSKIITNIKNVFE